MSGRRLRAFISSRMQELAPERKVIRSALGELLVEAFVFEMEAGARPESIQETYLEEVEVSDLYVGIFWKGYGSYMIEEFDMPRSWGWTASSMKSGKTSKAGVTPSLKPFWAGSARSSRGSPLVGSA